MRFRNYSQKFERLWFPRSHPPWTSPYVADIPSYHLHPMANHCCFWLMDWEYFHEPNPTTVLSREQLAEARIATPFHSLNFMYFQPPFLLMEAVFLSGAGSAYPIKPQRAFVNQLGRDTLGTLLPEDLEVISEEYIDSVVYGYDRTIRCHYKNNGTSPLVGRIYCKVRQRQITLWPANTNWTPESTTIDLGTGTVIPFNETTDLINGQIYSRLLISSDPIKPRYVF